MKAENLYETGGKRACFDPRFKKNQKWAVNACAACAATSCHLREPAPPERKPGAKRAVLRIIEALAFLVILAAGSFLLIRSIHA